MATYKKWSDLFAQPVSNPPDTKLNVSVVTQQDNYNYHKHVVVNAHALSKELSVQKYNLCGDVCQFKPPTNKCFGCQLYAKHRHSCEGYDIKKYMLPNTYGQYDCFCNECPKCEKSYYYIIETESGDIEGGPCVCGYGTPERI